MRFRFPLLLLTLTSVAALSAQSRVRLSTPSAPGRSAMTEPLKAPIEVPRIRSGVIPAWSRARSIPTSTAPQRPPARCPASLTVTRGVFISPGTTVFTLTWWRAYFTAVTWPILISPALAAA